VGKHNIGFPINFWKDGEGPYYPQEEGVTEIVAKLMVDLDLGLYAPWPKLQTKLAEMMTFGQQWGWSVMVAVDVKDLMRSGLPFATDAASIIMRAQVLAKEAQVSAERRELITLRTALLEQEMEELVFTRLVDSIKHGRLFGYATPAKLAQIKSHEDYEQLGLKEGSVRQRLNHELFAYAYPENVTQLIRQMMRSQPKRHKLYLIWENTAKALCAGGFFQPLDDRLAALRQPLVEPEQAYATLLATAQAKLAGTETPALAIAA
jgi:hypothetical protein